MGSVRGGFPGPASVPEPAPIVFVVDDDISVRESLEALVRHEGWRPEVFESAQRFLTEPLPSGPCCLILDVDLPDLSGLDLQQRVAADHASMPIIFLTGYGDIPSTVRAMKAGAAEFLTKPFDDEALLQAVRSAIERSRAILEQEAELKLLKERFETLSKREREVMALVVKGMLNKQVGGELGISEITVKAHRGNVMEKMKAKSFAGLVKMASSLGIAPAWPE